MRDSDIAAYELVGRFLLAAARMPSDDPASPRCASWELAEFSTSVFEGLELTLAQSTRWAGGFPEGGGACARGGYNGGGGDGG